ncbi:MAG TPA: hypothetical protein ENG98_01805 [Actinobacteria bacterium]|nr:hypothetical protein [Actinomycetota bacterium]
MPADSSEEISPHHLMFAYIGLGMHLVAGFFIVVSLLVMPWPAVAGLGLLWLTGALHSIGVWREKVSRPLVVAMGVSVAWILALTFR